MPENMNISVNGQSRVPPGFRFHPTEEELLHYYLRKKISYEKIDLDVIPDVDLNKLEPWDIQVEATQEEGWVVCRVFKKKNLHKTLDSPRSSTISGETGTGHHMYDSCNEGALEQILQHMSTSTTITTCKEETTGYNNNINNHLRFSRPIMDTTSGIHINGYICNNDPFLKLPSLESPNSTSNNNNNSSQNCYKPMIGDSSLTSWSAFDQLVASQLNGQNETSRQLACFNDPTTMAYTTDDDHLHDFHQLMPTLRSSSSLSSNRSYHGGSEDYNSSEIDLWNFTRSSSSLSSSDPICHVSNTSV
ncbi:hypothetical protein EZV62_010090 [Acer yangbiense]|uniref:NAC domain-containing protein n=1 Tax=Acer yangbiense TaxID=1000413 RepID=A0A5C7I3D1_9ROSI|nr:hypothetical protein EZV62_010090 [Acer yangbiense]